MASLEQKTLIVGIFTILLLAYGQSVGTPDTQQALNTLFTKPFPILTQTITLQNCSIWDIACNGGNVAAATYGIAAGLFFIILLPLDLLGRGANFLAIIVSVFFGNNTASAQAVPFLTLFIVFAIILPVGYEFFRMFRGNSGSASGSTL